ncbi:MAG: flagellar hook-length control protein FliK [Lachnospiraceae bacterium]|nr:flagellar hook-length control protein FliK [Lachnospiraceae bacterium]
MDNPKINPLNAHAAGNRQTQAQARQHQAAGRNNSASVQANSASAARTKDFGVVQSPGRLYEGDIIRGEVSDLCNNDITITLEDNTILRAKITGNPMLSIGQTAAFRLGGVSGGSILLEAIKNSFTETELTLINKALDEAGLPPTQHNQSAVKALMDNMLPINKESIQHLMQQSYDYKTNDMNTLAIMNRLMMDINADTVKQFSSYMNGSHQLLGQIQDFAQNIPALLNTLASGGASGTLSAFGEKLLSIALYDNTGSTGSLADGTLSVSQLTASQMQELMELLSETPLTEDVIVQLKDGTLSVHDALALIRDAIISGTAKMPEGITQESITDQLFLINMALGQGDGEEAVMQQTENSIKNIPPSDVNITAETEEETSSGTKTDNRPGNAEITEGQADNTADKAGSRFNFANKFLQTITETAKNSFNNTLNFLQQAATPGTKQELPQIHTIIDTLADLYNKESRQSDSLGSFLTASERNELLAKFDSLPVSKSFINKVVSGEATAKEVITVVKNIIPLAEPSAVQGLLGSHVFENILGKFLQSSWTLTPDKLKKDGEVNSFYDKMKTQLRQFEGLIQTALSGEDSDNMGRSAHDMESNIEFMKTLSETFSYLQMPLKLQNQDAHADLYVYTQKEKLKHNPENVHVLLHLTLEHLGDIDIYLDKKKNDINAKFSLEDLPSIDLIRTNSDILKSALNGQGYSCQVDVSQAGAGTSTVNEFVDAKINTSATADMKRFSFDIRA